MSNPARPILEDAISKLEAMRKDIDDSIRVISKLVGRSAAAGGIRRKFSAETRRKMSEAQKRRYQNLKKAAKAPAKAKGTAKKASKAA